MIMEFDSNSMTPPSSPILGYSGSRQNDLAASGLVFCFSCKGQIRAHDHTFSPDGYILRREVISAIEILIGGKSPNHVQNNFEKPCLCDFFGYNFDLTDKLQLKRLVNFCRKNIATLENMSLPFQNGTSRSSLGSIIDLPDSWKLRREVCLFFNYVINRMKYYRLEFFSNDNEIENVFGGLRKSVMKSPYWSSSLKMHCGSREGNDCSTPEYHLFHLNLELRWSLLIIYGLSSLVVDGIFEDLMYLAWFKYNYETEQSLSGKHPFNCYCIKELWTMLRLILDELKPNEKNFWDLFMSSLKRFTESTQTEFFFALWLIVNIASLSDYTICGVYTPESNESIPEDNNELTVINPICYATVNNFLSEWKDRGGKTVDVMILVSQLIPHWGFNIGVVQTFLHHWLPRIDKNKEITNVESYISTDSWLKLIKSVCSAPKRGSESELLNNTGSKFSDSFLIFVRLLVWQAQMCDEKNWRKLKSNICFKLDKKNVSKFSEVGLRRTSTLYLALAFATNDSQSLCERMTDALKEAKNTTVRSKLVVQATATMTLVLLQKSINVSTLSSEFMKTINDLMSQTVTDPKKDLIMIYMNLLECLPFPGTPAFSDNNLGRATLISMNLSTWLFNSGASYVTRSLRILNKLTSWIISSKNIMSDEKEELTLAIFSKIEQYLTQSVATNQNRLPSNDVEPMANLAADLTILSKLYNIGEGFQKLFDRFAMFERTCPEISELYISNLLNSSDYSIHCLTDVKWLQVWIRLIALGCPVPDKLNEKVLGSLDCGSDNNELLKIFCKKGENFNRSDIQSILSPLVLLVKSAVNSVFKDSVIMTSIVTSCAIITKYLKFDNIYIRGDTRSFLHDVLNQLFPPVQSPLPWDRLPPPIVEALGNHMPDFCETIITQGQFSQDQYLQRKCRDIANFSFLGFSKTKISSSNPGLMIMLYATKMKPEFILNDIIPGFGNILGRDSNLIQRFMVSVIGCKDKGLSTVVISCLPTVISTFIAQITDPTNCCIKIISYCCAFGKSNSKAAILKAFENEMEKNFAFKSKRFYDMFFQLNGSRHQTAILFLKEELVPLIESQIELCEMKRGIGKDNSLRQPLERLKREITAATNSTL